jgi:hypothetical protein
MMLIDFKGLKTNDFYIPPFTLSEGEIIVLNLQNGMHFYELSMWIKDLFTQKIKHESIIVNSPLSFVDYFKESFWRRNVFPVTVKEFLKKNADAKSNYAGKIYDITWITDATRVNTLAGTPRKMLTLYATLSKTNNIVFDLSGVDPIGGEQIYDIVKAVVKNGGSAILLDHCPEMKNNCTRYLEVEFFNIKRPDTIEFTLKK